MNLISSENAEQNNFKCHFCTKCDGNACIGEMPGMGGPNGSINFLHNCSDWEKIPFGPIKFDDFDDEIDADFATSATCAEKSDACAERTAACAEKSATCAEKSDTSLQEPQVSKQSAHFNNSSASFATKTASSLQEVQVSCKNRQSQTKPRVSNKKIQALTKKIALAPITGAQENIGWANEKNYYFEMTKACENAGIEISLGDGTPDEKLLWGIEAVKSLQKSNPQKKVSVFIKPYPQEKFFERIEWALPVAKIIGVDIDSYNIVTMRNLVHLEKKTESQLLEIKNHLANKKIPFAIKGVFTDDDLELVKKVQPDIIYISNHGGRVETLQGSTARFLEKNASELKKYCKELWIDGGIRKIQDVKKALSYGADKILLGRPFITALCLKKDFKTLLLEFFE